MRQESETCSWGTQVTQSTTNTAPLLGLVQRETCRKLRSVTTSKSSNNNGWIRSTHWKTTPLKILYISVPLIGDPFFRGIFNIFQNFVHISDRNCGVLNGHAARLRQLTIHHRKLLHSVRARLRNLFELWNASNSEASKLDNNGSEEAGGSSKMHAHAMHTSA